MKKPKARCRAYLWSYAEAMAYVREMDRAKKAAKKAVRANEYLRVSLI